MGLRGFFLGECRPGAAAAPVTRIDIERPEGQRHYLKAVPRGPAAAPRPLVIILHGGGASAGQVLGMAFPHSPLSL